MKFCLIDKLQKNGYTSTSLITKGENMYGYYKPENGKINVYRFIIENFLNICALFMVEPPQAIVGNIKDLNIQPENRPKYTSVASVTKVRAIDKTTGEKVAKYFLILDTDTADLQDLYHKISAKEFFLALWEVIFHEARHIVQLYLFESDQRQLIGLRDILAIKQLNPDVASWVQEKMKGCKEEEYKVRRMEFDATVIECLVYLNFINSMSCDEEVNFNKLCHLLVLNRKELLEKLDLFVPNQTSDNTLPRQEFDFTVESESMLIGLKTT